MLERRILVMTLVCDRKRAMQRLFETLGKSRHSRPLRLPAIMIAVGQSGNNNLAHIVRSDHGERPVPRFVFRPVSRRYPHVKRAAFPEKAFGGPAACRLNSSNAKPVPDLANFAMVRQSVRGTSGRPHRATSFPSRTAGDADAYGRNPS